MRVLSRLPAVSSAGVFLRSAPGGIAMDRPSGAARSEDPDAALAPPRRPHIARASSPIRRVPESFFLSKTTLSKFVSVRVARRSGVSREARVPRGPRPQRTEVSCKAGRVR